VTGVLATREGLVGRVAASGWRITPYVPAVALPSHAALWRFVWVRNKLTNLWTPARVLDVGPWNDDDDAYVFGNLRPQAESGTDRRGRTTNKAGIDLSEFVWHKLGMQDNGLVDWTWADDPLLYNPAGFNTGTS